MRFVSVLIASAAALFGATACSEAVANSAAVWVTVDPANVQAGSTVTIRASCVDNTSPASVMSVAFGTVTVQPVNGSLNGEAMIPPDKEKGSYDVRLSCPGGSSANTTLVVLNTAPVKETATLGPHTGGGFLAGAGTGAPIDRGALWWLGVGLASLITAAATTVRAKHQQVRRDAASDGRR